MELQITREGGQYQFWHIDCENNRGGILKEPLYLENNLKLFECTSCGKVGAITLKSIATGQGTMVEVEGDH